MQIWKVKFGHIVKFLLTLITRFGQDFEVQAKFEAEVWPVFFLLMFVKVMKLNLGRDSEDV